MSYAKTTLVQSVRNQLHDHPWEATSTTTTTSTTVAVPDGTKWSAGDVGEWSYTGTVGGEQFLVQSVSGNNLTVVRGYNGTTAETHTSGDRVVKNPAWFVKDISDEISRVIDDLFPYVYIEASASITPNTTARWIDSGLTGTNASGLIGLIRGEQLYGNTSQYAGTFGHASPYIPNLPLRVAKDLPTGLVSSGIGLRFSDGFHDNSNTVTVRYAVRITDTLSSGNYSDLSAGELVDAIIMGVCAKLLTSGEARNLSGDRRLGQAAAGTYVQTAAWFDLKFRQLLRQYRRWLDNDAPIAPDQEYLPGWMV